MTPNLTGKIVVVTGASGTLGQALLDAFAPTRATLAAIVPTEAEAQKIRVPQGADLWAFPADVTDEAAVRDTFDGIADQFGGVDVLLHAVGSWQASPLLDTALEDWRRMLDLNLTSAFLCFREAARRMTGRTGRIIAFASRQGADRAPAEQAAYAASKAGLIRLVESTAAEFQGHITAHAIAPSMLAPDGSENGVSAAAIATLCLRLCTEAGDALNGATLRAYGRTG
jgi:3-oxoacyl-[acyl-carrier protein] reductase